MPARAVTGPNWSGKELDFRRSPGEYAAIHFHRDDLDDAAWQTDFRLIVPSHLKSGVYAARLRTGVKKTTCLFLFAPLAASEPRRHCWSPL